MLLPQEPWHQGCQWLPRLHPLRCSCLLSSPHEDSLSQIWPAACLEVPTSSLDSCRGTCCHTQELEPVARVGWTAACMASSPAAGASAAVPSARLGRLVGVSGSGVAINTCSCAWTTASLRPLLSTGLSEGLPAAPDRDGWLLSSRWRWRRLRARALWSATAPLAFPGGAGQHMTSGW